MLEAFARLEHDRSFQVIAAWVREQQADAVKLMAVASDLRALGNAQGRYDVTTQFLSAAEHAHGTLRARASRLEAKPGDHF